MNQNNIEILVNMPDCTNILFYFRNDIIIKKVKKSYAKSRNAVVYYNLTSEIQSKIFKFLHPDAILK